MSEKSISKLLFHGRLLPGLVLALHLPFAVLPMLKADVRSVDFWIPPACLGVLLLLCKLRRLSPGIRWGGMGTLLLLADAVCLALAFSLCDPGWAGLGCVCAVAAFSASQIDRAGDRHLGGLALLIWAATGLPEDFAASMKGQAVAKVTQFVSSLAWRLEISAYREGQTLHSLSNVVSIPEVLWNSAAWTCVFLMTIFWGVFLRRSVMQTLGLLAGMALIFLLATSLQVVWLLQQPSEVAFGRPLTVSVCLLPVYLGLLASADFFIRLISAPIPVVGRQAESGTWDNPFIYYWNTLVSGFAMVPLRSASSAGFRLPLTAAVLCVLLLPIPPLVLVSLLSRPSDQLLPQTFQD